jgi:hypothetical protein
MILSFQAFAFSYGYIKALIQAVNSEVQVKGGLERMSRVRHDTARIVGKPEVTTKVYRRVTTSIAAAKQR